MVRRQFPLRLLFFLKVKFVRIRSAVKLFCRSIGPIFTTGTLGWKIGHAKMSLWTAATYPNGWEGKPFCRLPAFRSVRQQKCRIHWNEKIIHDMN
jgi:hypothetical protein